MRCLLEKIRCHLAYSTLTFESMSLREAETHNLGCADWPGSSWDHLLFTLYPWGYRHKWPCLASFGALGIQTQALLAIQQVLFPRELFPQALCCTWYTLKVIMSILITPQSSCICLAFQKAAKRCCIGFHHRFNSHLSIGSSWNFPYLIKPNYQVWAGMLSLSADEYMYIQGF